MSIRPPEDDLIQLGRPSIGSPRPADAAVLGWAAVAGVVADLAVRSGLASVATALLVATASAGLILSGRVLRKQAVVVVLAAPPFGGWLAVRSSPWLLAPDVLAAFGLLALGSSLQAGGDAFDLGVPDWVRRASTAMVHAAAGGAFLIGGTRTVLAGRGVGRVRAERVGPLVRGLVVAVPTILVLGALLKSGDPVFASFVSVHINGADLLAHPILIALGAWGAGGCLRLASVTSPAAPSGRRVRLGTTEALVVLAGVDCLFALFAVAQLVAVTGGADHVLRTTGLTYADYARSGYFQLLWVAGLTLALLVTLDTIVDRPERSTRWAFGIAGTVAAALTILIALVAFRRLAIYENAFGLTMLRLSCQVFAVWLTAVFGLLALSLLGAWPTRRWFVSSALTAALAVLLVFNAVNPEALVARRDLQRGPNADVSYLATLSDDAVPTILARAGDLTSGASANDLATVCALRDHHHGWASFNIDRSRAERAISGRCQPRAHNPPPREASIVRRRFVVGLWQAQRDRLSRFEEFGD